MQMTKEYIEQSQEDQVRRLWLENSSEYIKEEEFFRFVDSFGKEEKAFIEGAVNINGTGASPCPFPNLSSLAALYASQISEKNFVKTGSGANTGVHGSSDFFRDIGLINLHSQTILDEFHFLYFDYLTLSPWKKYKAHLSQNESMKKIFEEYFFLDYTAADYFIGINGLEWYDKFTVNMKLYNAPKNLYLYYTEKDGKLYDEIYEGTIYLNGKEYCSLERIGEPKAITASNIVSVNKSLLEGGEEGIWKQCLGYTVAMVLCQIKTANSLEEGLELFEKYYREKRLCRTLERILKAVP